MKELVLMCGPSASGKSTYIREHFARAKIVSRDAIRFEMLKPDEDYFAHEKEVLQEFYSQIEAACKSAAEVVVVDATNLTPKTRAKVLRYANGRRKRAISFNLPLGTLIEHNNNRSGLAKVPISAIEQQKKCYKVPDEKEFDIVEKVGE